MVSEPTRPRLGGEAGEGVLRVVDHPVPRTLAEGFDPRAVALDEVADPLGNVRSVKFGSNTLRKPTLLNDDRFRRPPSASGPFKGAMPVASDANESVSWRVGIRMAFTSFYERVLPK